MSGWRRAGLVAARIVMLLIAGAVVAEAGQDLDPTAMSLEDLIATPVEHVYGASKFLQKITDAPAAVTVVTADDIRLYGYRTLADVLRSVEGVSVSYDRNYTYIGLRGLSRPGDLNNRVLVLIDGHLINDNIDEQSWLGTDFQLDTALVDRVEVIRGPSAAVYGSTAFAAVVSVVTRRGHQVNGFEAAASVERYNTTRSRITWGRQFASGLELLASGSAYRSDGHARVFFPEFNTPGSNGGYADHSDGDRANTCALSGSFGAFTLHALYSGRTKQVPTASYRTVFNSGRERTFDDRSSVDLQYTREMGQSVKVLARAYWDRYLYDGDYPYAPMDDTASGLVINRDHFYGIWWGSEIDLSRRLGRVHNVTLGAEFRQNSRQVMQNYDLDSRRVYMDRRPHGYTLALNLQDEYTLDRHVLLNLAGREERTDTGAMAFTPKVGMILTPRPGSTVKLLFSRALRAPSAYELDYDSPAFEGNRELESERTQALELNVEQHLTSAMSIAGSVFRNSYSHLIVVSRDSDGDTTAVNGTSVRFQGIELCWSVRAKSGAQARLSYSMLSDQDARSDAWASGAPKRLAKANVGVPMASLGLRAGFEVQYESERQTHTGEVLAPAVVTNVNIIRSNLLRGVDLQAAVYNLFGERYSEPVSEDHVQGGIAQDGRRASIGLAWRFK